jgi:adenosylcobinamide-GDP ribazoletransferase
MRRLQVALGCLTILPFGPRGEVQEQECGGSFVWFPLVGLLIGGVLLVVYLLTAQLFQPLVTGACVLLAWIILTGAIHLDGFGDVCDGLYGGHTPVERLRIMKDPHSGAMAVVGLSTLLLVKFALLSSLPRAAMVQTLLLAPCLGRYAMVLLGTTLPYARSEPGTAAAFVRSAHPRALIAATVMVLPVSWFVLGRLGVGLAIASMITGRILRAVFQRTLGGVTGDALGAAGELTEVLILFGVSLTTG